MAFLKRIGDVTRCPHCKAALEDATHTIQTRHDRRGLRLSCCLAWMSERMLLAAGVQIECEGAEGDEVVISQHHHLAL